MAARLVDTFDRGDAANLGGNWTTITGYLTLTIVSNEAKGTSSSTDGGNYWSGTGGALSLDQYAQGILGTAPGQTQGSVALLLRQNPSVNTHYFCQLAPGAGEGLHWTIKKRITGSSTLLVDAVPATWASGDVIRYQVKGTAIAGFRNNSTTASASVTDSAVDGSSVGGPYAGVFLENTVGTWRSWEAGDFAAPPTALIVRQAVPRADSW